METVSEAVRHRRYIDRSLLFSPLCPVYGITAVLLSMGLAELRGNYAFLFLGSALGATVAEWIAGHFLERVTGTRWWDYSKFRWNLDGYICLYASALWGVLGLILVEWGTPLLLTFFRWVPALPMQIVLCALLLLLAVDLLATGLSLSGLRNRMPRVETVGHRLAVLTLRLGLWIFRRCDAHIRRAHPAAVMGRRREKSQVSVFARGTSFYSITLLFAAGSLCGDLVETIFCRIRLGEWMSRSSLVWGPFSVVWGMALAGGTLLMYRYRHYSSSFFFVAGTLLGGLYEYLCSVCSTCSTASSGALRRWPGSGGSTPIWPNGSPRSQSGPESGSSGPWPSSWRWICWSAGWPSSATAPATPVSPPTLPGRSGWTPTTAMRSWSASILRLPSPISPCLILVACSAK